MAFFERDGKRIYYVVHGSGKPLLLLHGITNSGRAWAKQVGAFSRAGFQLIIPDFPGHGSSSRLNAITSPKTLAKDMIALLEFLNISKADCCGLSLGGTVAIEAAHSRPNMFSKLVIAASFARADTDGFRAVVEQWKALFAQKDGPVTRLEKTWPLLVGKDFAQSDEGVSTYYTWQAQAALADGSSYSMIAEGMNTYNATEYLPAIKHRALVLSGGADKISSVENSRELARAMPNCQHITIEDAQHIINADKAIEFNEIVLRFLTLG